MHVTGQGQSQEVSLDEARRMLQPQVDRLIGYMRERRLGICPFLVQSEGHHNEAVVLTIAVHAELLERSGYEVVSHHVWFENGPSLQDPAVTVEKTMCSLMVRAPRVVS